MIPSVAIGQSASHPGVFRDGRICSILNVKSEAIPEFGFSARVPLVNVGDLLIEAKLTESDLQRARKAAMGLS
jgi:hypothetical protein